MFREVIKERAVFGLDFGKPLRPISIEILKWDIGDGRVGYLEPHNSYFHILYRSGLVGLIFIITFFWLFVRLIFHSVKKDKIIGILLSSALLYWLILSNFIVLLEFPYFAIPFWSLFGMSIAYIFKNTNICVE
jgi:O-antigen ligase